MNIEWHRFGAADETGRALADAVLRVLEDAARERGEASLVVSGGSTPLPFFAALKGFIPAPLAARLTVTLADERCVAADHPDSNEYLVRQHLLLPQMRFAPLSPAPLLSSPRKQGEEKEYVAPSSLPKREDTSLFIPPLLAGEGKGGGTIEDKGRGNRWGGIFDAVVLGMGEDGHTASLFPHHPQLAAALVPDAPDCIAIHGAPKPPPERLTLSARRLMESRHLFIHIAGQSKHTVLQKAASSGDATAYPIAHFLRHPQCKVFWSEE